MIVVVVYGRSVVDLFIALLDCKICISHVMKQQKIKLLYELCTRIYWMNKNYEWKHISLQSAHMYTQPELPHSWLCNRRKRKRPPSAKLPCFLFLFLLKIESIGCTGHFVLQAWRTCCMQTAGRTSLSLSTLCKNVEFSRCVKNLQESCAMLSFKPPSLPLTFSLFDKCMNFVI